MSTLREGNGHGDPAALAGAAIRTFLRPGAYFGTAVEVWNALMHTAAYPSGLTSVEAWQESLEADRAVDAIDERLDPATAGIPILLVHGYVMNRAAFLVMSRALSKAGFRHVRAFGYPQFTLGLEATAESLGDEVDRALEETGASRCMLVGHSMGGIVARTFVELLGGAGRVDTVVTLGTPHAGTYTASFGIGPAAKEMTYHSAFLRRLDAAARPSGLRYLSYYSDLDTWVVPAVSAKLEHPALSVTNIRVRDVGHLSLLLSGDVIRSVVGYLAHPELARPPAERSGGSV